MSRPTSRRAPALGLVYFGLTCLVACSHTRRSGERLPAEIVEVSGMVRSPSAPGVFWVHSDSGNPPRIHAVDASGNIVARADIEGAANIDWEDIAARDGELFIADIGNNFQLREDLVILRIAEPTIAPGGDASPTRAPILGRIHIRYPDQKSYPALRPRFDGEALFWARDSLWIFSKHRDDHKTTLYRVVDPDSEAPQDLERIGDFEVGGHNHPYGGMVTAADVSADRRHLAVLSYHALFIFDLSSAEGALYDHPLRRIELRAPALQQCESVVWDGADLIITNEAGRIFRIETAADGPPILFPEKRE